MGTHLIHRRGPEQNHPPPHQLYPHCPPLRTLRGFFKHLIENRSTRLSNVWFMVVSSTSGLSTRRFDLLWWTTLQIVHLPDSPPNGLSTGFVDVGSEVGVNCLTTETLYGTATAKLSIGLNFEKVSQEGIEPEVTSMPSVHANDINLLPRGIWGSKV